MKKMDFKKDYCTVYGDRHHYEQDGVAYNLQGEEMERPKPVVSKLSELQIEHDQFLSARAFLIQILKENPLAKAVVYKAAEGNNQTWENVKSAAADLGIQKYKQGASEMWKLPEEARV